MALYITMRIEAGKMNYNKIFKFSLYKQFQDDVDSMLAVDGYVIGDDGFAVKTKTEEV
jgi:hypothetical protein